MDELEHSGVLGMRWGVRRAINKQAKTSKLEKKALDFDKKAARNERRAENIHSQVDLRRANISSTYAARLRMKAATKEKQALKADTQAKVDKLLSKAATYKYKATKHQMQGDRRSKTIGYGKKSMYYLMRSDHMKVRAAYVRKKIANNTRYINTTKRKLSSMKDDQKIDLGKKYLDQLL